MEATKLLLFLAFHVGDAESSGNEISNQETRPFFDRALQAAVLGYDLDPLKFPGVEFEVSVTVAKVKLYNITVHGLGNVCRAGENIISADNNGTCLKIDVAMRNVTISVRANVTVSIFFYIDANDGNKCVPQLHGSYTGHQREKCETKGGTTGNIRNRGCRCQVIQYR
uniref:Putative secreted protein n=1 Tax=Ixodes ricinus TaxID=34613 RepID=A0A0K8RL58_IXORI